MTPILKATGIGKNYVRGGTELTILSNLELTLSTQQTVSIVGKSGSGKSTLLALLAGLDRPTTGSIWYGDQDLARLSQDELSKLRARHLGIVFQQYFLIPTLTALENIALPLEILRIKTAEERAEQLLHTIGLFDRRDHFPGQLSGGECQRVAIARAIATKPSIVLADEPTGSLDQSTGNHITDLLFNVAEQEKATLVLVTHNAELASRCQRRLTLQNGCLHEALT